jgi:hypothetical protein
VGVAEAVVKVGGGSAGSEEAVGIVAGRQIDNPHAQAGIAESLGESQSGMMSCGIGIECDKHGTVGAIGELGELHGG